MAVKIAGHQKLTEQDEVQQAATLANAQQRLMNQLAGAVEAAGTVTAGESAGSAEYCVNVLCHRVLPFHGSGLFGLFCER